MKRGRAVSLVVLMFLTVILAATAASAQGLWPGRTNLRDELLPAAPSHLEFIGNLYTRTANGATLVVFGPNGNRSYPNPEELPLNWNLGEVRTNADGSIRVITGSQALLAVAGIRVWHAETKAWTEASSSCADDSISIFNNETYYAACDTSPGFWVYRVPFTGVPRYPVFSTLYEIYSAAVNPVDGRLAIAEARYVQTAGTETPDDYSDDIWTYQSRLIIVSNSGEILKTFDWVDGFPAPRGIRWSPDGKELMYLKDRWNPNPPYEGHTALYRTDLSGYGSQVQADVDCFTWLPGGGYAYSLYVCPPPKCYPRFTKNRDATSYVAIKSADGTTQRFTLKGRLVQIDAYLR